MKFTGWHQQRVEIDLDENEIVRATIDIVKKKFKLENVDGLDDKGQMYENVEYATSHSWTKKEDRGEPTPVQKRALELIHELKALKNT